MIYTWEKLETWDPTEETRGEKELWKFVTPYNGRSRAFKAGYPMGLIGQGVPDEEGYYPPLRHSKQHIDRRKKEVFQLVYLQCP